jgi:hypothetical protein
MHDVADVTDITTAVHNQQRHMNSPSSPNSADVTANAAIHRFVTTLAALYSVEYELSIQSNSWPVCAAACRSCDKHSSSATVRCQPLGHGSALCMTLALQEAALFVSAAASVGSAGAEMDVPASAQSLHASASATAGGCCI